MTRGRRFAAKATTKDVKGSTPKATPAGIATSISPTGEADIKVMATSVSAFNTKSILSLESGVEYAKAYI